MFQIQLILKHNLLYEFLKVFFLRCLICFLLNDFSCMDRELVIKYLTSCQTYEGGFAFVQAGEAHGNPKVLFQPNSAKVQKF